MPTKHFGALVGLAGLLVLAHAVQGCSQTQEAATPDRTPSQPASTILSLPRPDTGGEVPLERALTGRRSVREFAARGLSTAQVGQLLWAAQGVTDREGRRTAPSAGALYPLELLVVLPEGSFRYLPAEHALAGVRDGDLRPVLRSAALGQEAVADAPLVVVIAAVPARTAAKYGDERAMRYVLLEAGHAAQNLLLEAVVLGLGAVPVGAFDDARVAAILGLGPGEVPLYLVPVGYPLDDALPTG